MSPTTKSGYNYIFSGIKNADAITASKKSPKTLGAYALNKHTLQVKLEHPMPYFDKMMVLPAFFPENPTALKKFGSKYGTQSKYLYYNGPFKVTGWNGTNDSWTLKRNNHYYDQKAIHLDELKYSVVKDANTAHELFDQKKLDDATITGVTAKGLQQNKDLIHERKAGTYYLRLNVRNGKPLATQKMRQAISLVLNRKQLTKDVLADGSQPAYTYTAPDLAKDPTTGKDFATETKPSDTYNVAKAKQLWTEGVKESGQKGTVKMAIVGDDQTITKNVAQFVQASVKKNHCQALTSPYGAYQPRDNNLPNSMVTSIWNKFSGLRILLTQSVLWEFFKAVIPKIMGSIRMLTLISSTKKQKVPTLLM